MVEVVVSPSLLAAETLRAQEHVEEVAPLGEVLRVATRDGVDPEALVRSALGDSRFDVREIRPSRATVEDAFVAMVRAETRNEAAS